MAFIDSDTICAIATSPGRSGIGIVRVSGKNVKTIASSILGSCPNPRHVHYCDFLDANKEVIDQGLAIFFESPHSFTGEDVLELHGHGSPFILNSLLQRVQENGARMARPGEFTERAFLNDKLDLLQAEAIADLIDASSRQAARSAMRTLKGDFSRRIHRLVEQLVQVRVNVEAAIDFSDEDIDVLADTEVLENLRRIKTEIEETFASAEQGAILMHGINVVLAGAPNAGKSSLMNALSGQDSAIVTDIPGTTRDLLSSQIMVGNLPVHITDTAGLRESTDVVEREGVKRAHRAIEEADLILLIVDESSEESRNGNTHFDLLARLEQSDTQHQELLQKTVLVSNKIDLTSGRPGQDRIEVEGVSVDRILLSAKTGSGLELLGQYLQQVAGLHSDSEDSFVARERHLLALRGAVELVESALAHLGSEDPLELAAEDLRLAQHRLGEITGEFTSDDLLGEIFSQFCLGK